MSWVTINIVRLPARQILTHVVLDDDAGLGIQRRKWLVEQKHLRLHRQGLRQRGALLHSAGQSMGIFSLETAEPVLAHQGLGLLAPHGLWLSAYFQTELDVFDHGPPRQ